MQRGQRGLAGQPNKPYAQFDTYAGSDVWLELEFLDRTNTPASPASASYRIDNISNYFQVLGDTPIPYTPGDTSYELNIPASLNVLSGNWNSSQLFQVLVTAIFADGSQVKKPFIYELVAINTTGGQ